MGEGACIVVLESLTHARRRGAQVLGEVVGYALTNDAHHMTAPRPDGKQAARTIRLALADAGLKAYRIGYINAHGSSTVLGDAAEAAAIRTGFGRYLTPEVLVSATKGLYGHPLGASGAIEAAIDGRGAPHRLAAAHHEPGAARSAVRLAPGTGRRATPPDGLRAVQHVRLRRYQRLPRPGPPRQRRGGRLDIHMDIQDGPGAGGPLGSSILPDKR